MDAGRGHRFPAGDVLSSGDSVWLGWLFIHVAAAILYRVSFPPAAQAFDAALIPHRGRQT